MLKGTKGSGDLIKGLSATQGVVVELQDPDGNQIDIFRIGEDMSRANSYSRIPDGTGVWYYTDVTGTQNATNGTNTSGLESIIALPWITGLTQDIMFPTATDAVKVSATVRTISGTTLTSVILKWTLDGNAQSDITMANLGNTYSGTIAAQAVGAEIVYTVVATNSENGTAESSEDYTVSSTAIDYSKLVINEIDGNGKFVEIYNNASYDIPLVGITLIKNEETASNKIWWTGLDGAIIEAGKYYTIVQSGLLTPTGASEYTGASGISPKKTLKFELKTSNGTILDTFSRLIEGSSTLDADCLPDYSKTPKYSFSRCPDGIGEFKLAVPSCNAQNPSTSDDPIVTTPLTP